MMNGEKKKKILISAVSGADPHKNDNYGPLLSIIQYYKNNNDSIDEVYIYLTSDFAVSECIYEVYKTTIRHIDPNIKISFIPEGILEKIKPIIEEYKSKNTTEEEKLERIKQMITLSDTNSNLQKEKNDERIKLNHYANLIRNKKLENVNVEPHIFGNLYEEISKLISKIKANNTRGSYRLLFNVTSGTPAMLSDLTLVAITNKDVESDIIQVNDVKTNTLNLNIYDVSSEKLNEIDSKTNETLLSRINTNVMEKTKLMVLLNNIELSFEKYDFVSIYNNIKFYESIINNKKIIVYAKNLYNRYIGNIEEANIDLEKNNIKISSLYPIYDFDKNSNIRFSYIIEKLNILKVKSERKEVYDWLLLVENIIESLYGKLLYFYLKKGKKTLCKDKKFLTASEMSEEIKKIVKNTKKEDNKDILEKIKKLDCIRSIRNDAAHEDIFITPKELDYKYTEKLNHKKIKRSNPNVTEEIYNIIKELLIDIMPANYTTNKNKSLFNKSLKSYKIIEENIIKLLKDEIYNGKE